ncbi:MAG: VWA domain-containing protein [Alphaproteobacteria bacterium]|nr:VWA domain-containing protein [Alphaproteobacteria bacterium]
MIIFAFPLAFLLLFLPLLVRILPPLKGMHGDALRVPKTYFEKIKTLKQKSIGSLTLSLNEKHIEKLKLGSLFIIYVLLVTALARPQIVGERFPIKSESREILIVMDISTSMLERDYKLNNRPTDRLTAVKKVASDFIRKRTNDKIGLILFGTNAYLQAPITSDRASVEKTLLTMDAGMAGNSTAIGDALGLALKTLKDDEKKDKKSIILLTDGENNDGSLNIADAIELAKKEGIKVYTIGVGTQEQIVQSMFGININFGRQSDLDEKSLKELANVTEGTYFRADNMQDLERIYQLIDDMEPTTNEDKIVQNVEEVFYLPLIFAVLFSFILILSLRKIK